MNIPIQIIGGIEDYAGYIVRLGVARNPNTSSEALEQLVTDKENDVRYNVACNPNAHPKALEILETDEYSIVRRRVAINPNTPRYLKKYFKIQDHLRTLRKLS